MSKPSSPRVVHATECLAAGTLAFLVQATSELAHAGVDQVLVYSRRPDTPPNVESLFDARVELLEIAAPRLTHANYFRDLRRALRVQLHEPNVTAIHLHSSKAGFFGRLGLVGLRKRPPVFYSPHGLAYLDGRRPVRSAVFRGLEWLGARIDCTLVGCSRSEAALLQQLSANPTRVLENAVDNSFFKVSRDEAHPPLVVSVGRACHQKAPERFAALATRFQLADIPLRFVWIGSGDPHFEDQLRAAGVHVTGWVDPSEVQRLLGRASVYVQTSRWEGMPLSVLQALAAGVPCVVTNAVGNRDAVRTGITGFVADSMDEMLMVMQRLLQDDILRRRLSIAARIDAQERFSGASFGERLCQLYQIQRPTVVAEARLLNNLLTFPRNPSAGFAAGQSAA